MRVILLPGQHISNKEWIENVEKKFKRNLLIQKSLTMIIGRKEKRNGY